MTNKNDNKIVAFGPPFYDLHIFLTLLNWFKIFTVLATSCGSYIGFMPDIFWTHQYMATIWLRVHIVFGLLGMLKVDDKLKA